MFFLRLYENIPIRLRVIKTYVMREDSCFEELNKIINSEKEVVYALSTLFAFI